jgi:hypothetical protein
MPFAFHSGIYRFVRVGRRRGAAPEEAAAPSPAPVFSFAAAAATTPASPAKETTQAAEQPKKNEEEEEKAEDKSATEEQKEEKSSEETKEETKPGMTRCSLSLSFLLHLTGVMPIRLQPRPSRPSTLARPQTMYVCQTFETHEPEYIAKHNGFCMLNRYSDHSASV